ncbi:MAG TPA: hypothetical protein PLD84_06310, partial [Chitinophagales bacterium]|nr:hypothetical protein [Chitinophagales bacterium]
MKHISVILIILFVLNTAYLKAQSTYIWKPIGASTSVKIPANWKIGTCNGSAATALPGSSDTLLFSNCSGSNAVIDTNLNVSYVQIKSNYTGTVTQSGSYNITAAKMKVSGGTFTGGSGTITINGTFTVDGGTFTSTSGLLIVRGNFSKTGS